jgi:hypothetical protein
MRTRRQEQKMGQYGADEVAERDGVVGWMGAIRAVRMRAKKATALAVPMQVSTKVMARV